MWWIVLHAPLIRWIFNLRKPCINPVRHCVPGSCMCASLAELSSPSLKGQGSFFFSKHAKKHRRQAHTAQEHWDQGLLLEHKRMQVINLDACYCIITNAHSANRNMQIPVEAVSPWQILRPVVQLVWTTSWGLLSRKKRKMKNKLPSCLFISTFPVSDLLNVIFKMVQQLERQNHTGFPCAFFPFPFFLSVSLLPPNYYLPLY